MTTTKRRQQIAEAAARLRAKRKAEGLVRVEVWLHPDNAAHVRAYADEIEAERKGH